MPLFLFLFLDWQMMEEIFIHVSGSSSALPAMVQILADFASADGWLFWLSFLFSFFR